MKKLFILIVTCVAMFLSVGCCETGSHKCDGGHVYTCSESGEWEFDEYCSNGCSDGYCNGPCSDFQHECGDNVSFYCLDGVWWESAKCSDGCDKSTGKCKGLSYNDCVHGQYGCDDSVAYRCIDGHWEQESCPYGCNPSTNQCDSGWYYKCIDGDSYYCSPESCNIVEVCHQYGCDNSTGKCNTTLPNGSDDEDQAPSSGIPECSSISLAPCKDSSSGLMWSDKAYYTMSWEAAVDYCSELYKGGFSNWRVPDIDELRTVIQNNPRTVSGGKCAISEKTASLITMIIGIKTVLVQMEIISVN